MTVALNDQQTWPTCHFFDSASLSLSDTDQTVPVSLTDSNPESLLLGHISEVDLFIKFLFPASKLE